MNGPIAFVFLIIGLVAAGIVQRHLREAKKLRLREIIHEERIKAMDTNSQLPVAEEDRLNQFLGDFSAPDEPAPRNPAAVIVWVRLAALLLGLAGLFGGVGTAIGLSATSDPDINGVWSLGLIPTFIGVGLLVFYRMSRRMVPSEARSQGG
jgi:hypothetical protein